MKSVRATALLWIAAALTPIALAASAIAYVAGREEANFVSDGLLVQIAIHLAPELQTPISTPLLDDPEDEIAVSVWNSEGHLVHDNSGGLIPRQTASGFVDVTIGGAPWRIFVTHAAGRTIQVAQRQEVRDEVAEHLALTAALPVLAGLPLVWGLVAFSLTRLFRQLDDLSTTVARRDLHTTDPLPLKGVPLEIRSFVEAMNELLRRQATAIQQQRRFVSDAAHELRTPLTAVQILADTLAERSARREPIDADMIDELEAALTRARALINQLLKLAEVDSGRERPETAQVDVRQVLMEVLATAMPLASRKGMEFLVDAPTPVPIVAVAVDINTLLSVLVDNAIRYAPEKTVIEIRLLTERGHGVFEVRDHGSGIPEEDLPRLYDRFFRAAPQSIEGTGLGLAIAKAIADRNGCALVISNHPAGGVTAKVTLCGVADSSATSRAQSEPAS